MSLRQLALIIVRLRRGSTILSTSLRSLSNSLPRRAALEVGEIEGVELKVEPLRRTGEDGNTMRARLLCMNIIHFRYSSDLAPWLMPFLRSIDQSRKRGILESDLLLSTFADANLPRMTTEQLQQYDLFLDENDWDIYYWATQEPSPTSRETAEGGSADFANPAEELDTAERDSWRNGAPRSGEWAQTVGAFKPAYRPVPARWENSEILSMLRKHITDRKASATVGGEGLEQGFRTKGGGLGRMPEVQNLDI